MRNDRFNRLFKETMKKCEDILVKKGVEYSSASDKLHNFKASASLQATTPFVALRGKMAKHTISIYDMLNSGKNFPVEVWDEKIIDHINYLILLRGLIVEEHEGDNNA